MLLLMFFSLENTLTFDGLDLPSYFAERLICSKKVEEEEAAEDGEDDDILEEVEEEDEGLHHETASGSALSILASCSAATSSNNCQQHPPPQWSPSSSLHRHSVLLPSSAAPPRPPSFQSMLQQAKSSWFPVAPQIITPSSTPPPSHPSSPNSLLPLPQSFSSSPSSRSAARFRGPFILPQLSDSSISSRQTSETGVQNTQQKKRKQSSETNPNKRKKSTLPVVQNLKELRKKGGGDDEWGEVKKLVLKELKGELCVRELAQAFGNHKPLDCYKHLTKIDGLSSILPTTAQLERCLKLESNTLFHLHPGATPDGVMVCPQRSLEVPKDHSQLGHF
eukprot:CAMPEP_0201541864 /NCGR_PEP_ID=MMETSP0161_2-20130828/71704_1 /ASSEMBLY_ACC=CAM_ASM_000251 /TAXON_ID=180227 /ORGANISM="Neoparamoeba aestuarina, Strain SoJaBio B1-5/56/2" /LENGTH=334 /DNA_ID=CAMNT_0047949429 /DNA_START=549 /DNA_END=1553 /DNA_ORIENTATION=+